MWNSTSVILSILLFPTVLSLYSKTRLGAGMNSVAASFGTKPRTYRSSIPDYRYQAPLSREISKTIVNFLRSLAPAAQPSVNFMADAISDAVDATQARVLQTFENTNKSIIFVETFFKKMHEALVNNVNDDGQSELKPRSRKRALFQVQREKKTKSCHEVNRS